MHECLFYGIKSCGLHAMLGYNINLALPALMKVTIYSKIS